MTSETHTPGQPAGHPLPSVVLCPDCGKTMTRRRVRREFQLPKGKKLVIVASMKCACGYRFWLDAGGLPTFDLPDRRPRLRKRRRGPGGVEVSAEEEEQEIGRRKAVMKQFVDAQMPGVWHAKRDADHDPGRSYVAHRGLNEVAR